MVDLSITRAKIDEIDRQIISLFNERMKLADDVANYKIATGKPVYDPVREKEKLEVIEGFGDDDFGKTALRELFSQIMSISRKYQYRKIADVSETSLAVTSYSSDNIGFFGGSGTYTERAMKDFFVNDTKAKAFDSFEIPHKTGSLYSILSNFIYNNINMTNIESRPVPKRRWQYRFFVDFDGNLNDAGVINAITGLKAEADSFTLLGNYVGADKK